MMRWYIKWGIAALVAINAAPSFAKIIWVYGLDKAAQFHSQTAGTYYIQMGSFSSKVNADKMRNQLSRNHTQSISVKHTQGFYKVVIGPLNSANEVRMASRGNQGMKHSVHAVAHPKLIQQKPLQASASLPRQNQMTPSNPIVGDPEALYNRPGNFYGEVGVGQQSNRLNNQMLISNGSDFPAPFNLDVYTTSNPSQTSLTVGGGYRWLRDADWLPVYSAGLSYKHIFSQDIKGTITQYSLPEFLNYNYRWAVASDVVLATGKLNIMQKGRFSPFIKGGLGAAFNNTSQYNETALLDVTPRISPAFAAQHKGHFAYTAGAGLDVQLNRRVYVSVGYEYQDLGHVTSGYGSTTWSGQSLNLGSYTSNEVVLNLSYQFGTQA